jgi:hypothetical protein
MAADSSAPHSAWRLFVVVSSPTPSNYRIPKHLPLVEIGSGRAVHCVSTSKFFPTRNRAHDFVPVNSKTDMDPRTEMDLIG